MARKTVTHESYMKSLHTSAAAYFAVCALMLFVSAVVVTGETVVGAVSLAVIALLPAGIALFAGRELVKVRA